MTACPVVFKPNTQEEQQQWQQQEEKMKTTESLAGMRLKMIRKEAEDAEKKSTNQKNSTNATPKVLTGDPFTSNNQLSQCTIAKKQKKCLFIHGLGVPEEKGLRSNFSADWGNIKEKATCCSVSQFLHVDTVNSPWYSRELAVKICNAATLVAEENGTLDTPSPRPISSKRTNPKLELLRNMAIVTHSSGNLMFASALLHGGCALDSSSSKWISLEGPMRGSNTANEVLAHCKEPNSTWDNVVKFALKEFDLCPPKNSTKALVRSKTSASNACLESKYAAINRVYRAKVSASLCGVSPFGISSKSSAKYVALAQLSNHSSSENDGVVEFESCRSGLDAKNYSPTYRNGSKFYKAEINHEDGRFVNGDSAWGETRKPVKWFQLQFVH